MGLDPQRLGCGPAGEGAAGRVLSRLGGPFGRLLKDTCLVAPACQVETPGWHQPQMAHWQQECVTRGLGRCWWRWWVRGKSGGKALAGERLLTSGSRFICFQRGALLSPALLRAVNG